MPAMSASAENPQKGTEVRVVTGIYRYPIKGLSAQPVASVYLQAGRPFPSDRMFALARPHTPIDATAPKWAKKGMFVMLMLDEALAQVKTHLDVDNMRFTVAQGDRQILVLNLDDPSDCAKLERYFHRLVPSLRAAPRLVRARGGHFMDKPDNVLSLINLATIRSLGERWGVELDPLRFRANFYIDGARPWEEFGWLGRSLRIGAATFQVERRIGRCGATNVNPQTGQRDLDIPGAMRETFGHKDLGVYLATRVGGAVAVRDRVEVHRIESGVEIPIAARASAAAATAAAAAAGRRHFMCRGCYFVYDEALGLPQHDIPAGTAFAAIPPGWRCPDCGSEKSVYRLCAEPKRLRPKACAP
jgi:GntR family transcriptional regulator / MocR family aminotransferase